MSFELCWPANEAAGKQGRVTVFQKKQKGVEFGLLRNNSIHRGPQILHSHKHTAEIFFCVASDCFRSSSRLLAGASVGVCGRVCGEEGRGEREGRGHRGSRRDGVNTPAYMDWANIQFVPPRLSSTVAATQFLPIDLPATGTIAPGDATSPEYGAASQSASQQVSERASKRARE